MKKFITHLQKMATGKIVVFTFVPAMAVYLLMLLYTIPKVESLASGMRLFDLSPSGYSYQYAKSLLESLGEQGRSVYLYQQLPADFLYPGLFAVSCSLLLTWLFTNSFKADSKIFYTAIVPALGGLFDYLENISTILMIKSFPDLPQGLVSIASTFTVLKSVFTTVFFFLLFIGCTAFLVSRLKRSPATEN